jgi:hypothetical protein
MLSRHPTITPSTIPNLEPGLLSLSEARRERKYNGKKICQHLLRNTLEPQQQNDNQTLVARKPRQSNNTIHSFCNARTCANPHLEMGFLEKKKKKKKKKSARAPSRAHCGRVIELPAQIAAAVHAEAEVPDRRPCRDATDTAAAAAAVRIAIAAAAAVENTVGRGVVRRRAPAKPQARRCPVCGVKYRNNLGIFPPGQQQELYKKNSSLSYV